MKDVHTKCAYCNKAIIVKNLQDGDGVWTAFCSGEHGYHWQLSKSEDDIRHKDRCQWCKSKLRCGWHEYGCPVRIFAEKMQ